MRLFSGYTLCSGYPLRVSKTSLAYPCIPCLFTHCTPCPTTQRLFLIPHSLFRFRQPAKQLFLLSRSRNGLVPRKSNGCLRHLFALSQHQRRKPLSQNHDTPNTNQDQQPLPGRVAIYPRGVTTAAQAPTLLTQTSE